ncbi:MAG: helix-turn-helix domain-containing protein [Verrucomicrobiales bacterium]
MTRADPTLEIRREPLVLKEGGTAEKPAVFDGKGLIIDLGIDALTDRPKTGRPRSVSQEVVAKGILPLIEAPALAGQSHWTATKLAGWLKNEKDLPIAYSTLVRYLHEHDYKLKVPRPMPEPPNREDWETSGHAADELLDPKRGR